MPLTLPLGRRGARGAGHSDPDSKRESDKEDLLPCIHGKLGFKRFTEFLASEKEISVRKGSIIILLDRIGLISFILSIFLLQPRKYTEAQPISFLSQKLSTGRKPYLQVIWDSALLEHTHGVGDPTPALRNTSS